MNATRLSLSRRREDIRAWWSEHLTAQAKSGQNQVSYCRARGLDPKYFTLWKRKLRERPPTSPVARLVPVTVRPSVMPVPAKPRPPDELPATSTISLRLSLGSGLTVSLEIGLAALPTVLRELASLRC